MQVAGSTGIMVTRRPVRDCQKQPMVDITLDATGLRCPMPLLKAKLQLGSMTPGQQLEVLATDAGSARDIPAWLAHTAHELVSSDEEQGRFRFIIRVGNQE